MLIYKHISKHTIQQTFWALLVVTAFLLLKPMGDGPKLFPHADKVIHMLMFFSLGMAAVLAFDYRKLAYFSLVLYGLLTEYLQSALTTTRSGSLEDWLADMTGLVLSYLIYKRFFADKTA